MRLFFEVPCREFSLPRSGKSMARDCGGLVRRALPLLRAPRDGPDRCVSLTASGSNRHGDDPMTTMSAAHLFGGPEGCVGPEEDRASPVAHGLGANVRWSWRGNTKASHVLRRRDAASPSCSVIGGCRRGHSTQAADHGRDSCAGLPSIAISTARQPSGMPCPVRVIL